LKLFPERSEKSAKPFWEGIIRPKLNRHKRRLVGEKTEGWEKQVAAGHVGRAERTTGVKGRGTMTEDQNKWEGKK